MSRNPLGDFAKLAEFYETKTFSSCYVGFPDQQIVDGSYTESILRELAESSDIKGLFNKNRNIQTEKSRLRGVFVHGILEGNVHKLDIMLYAGENINQSVFVRRYGDNIVCNINRKTVGGSNYAKAIAMFKMCEDCLTYGDADALYYMLVVWGEEAFLRLTRD